MLYNPAPTLFRLLLSVTCLLFYCRIRLCHVEPAARG
ncbi:Uncharacterised protein [Salmonella enterica subsp. enterica]|uniref:Uncharacterized protein n=1 Tax=Salmonella enterica I TaxID=59201 RepID=A0A3S4IUW1_SALET|nr:Uncharacterised protein [Salmonella enterica subsp. enterica]